MEPVERAEQRSGAAGALPDWGVPVARSRLPVPIVALVAAGVLSAAIGFLIAPVAGIAAALVLIAVMALALAAIPGGVLRRERAERARPEDAPRLVNLVEGLSHDLGVAPPEVWVSAGPANAAAIHLSKPRLCVRRELLDTFTRTELEATVAFLLIGVVTGAARSATVPRWISPSRSSPDPAALDVYAVSVTRYPPALASALAKCSEAGAPGLWLGEGDIDARSTALLDL